MGGADSGGAGAVDAGSGGCALRGGAGASGRRGLRGTAVGWVQDLGRQKSVPTVCGKSDPHPQTAAVAAADSLERCGGRDCLCGRVRVLPGAGAAGGIATGGGAERGSHAGKHQGDFAVGRGRDGGHPGGFDADNRERREPHPLCGRKVDLREKGKGGEVGV